jgi:hypothetical protein
MNKQPWTKPEATPLTASGSRSDNPDVAIRNGTDPGSLIPF